MIDPRWYEQFFAGVVVEMWQSAVPPEQTRREVDFLEQALQLQKGQHLLDVPCGFGRHSIEFADRGYHVTGVDVSTEMIDEAWRASDAANLDIAWHNADMRNLGWEAAFDGAICYGNSFGYLDRAGTRAFLSAVAGALRPGARFALDYGMAAECILPRFTERQWAPVEGMLFLEENRYHAVESCLETTYTFVREGNIESRTGWHWVYTAAEVQDLLHQAGLHTKFLYRSIEGESFELGCPLMIVVAEKG